MALGMLAFSLGQWLVVASIAKYYGLSAAGQYALAGAITTPVFTFLSLNLRTVQASRTLLDAEGGLLGALRGTTLTLASVITIAIAQLAAGLSLPMTLTIAVVALKVLDGISDLNYGRLQSERKFARIASSQIARGVALCGIVSVSALLGIKLEMAILLVTALWGIIIIALEMSGDRRIMPKEIGHILTCSSWAALARLFIRLFPLGIAVGLMQAHNSASRIMLGHFGDQRLVGIFACLFYVAFIPHLMMTALGQRFTPELGERIRAGDDLGFRHLTRRLLLFAVALHVITVAGSVLCGKEVLVAIYGDQFSAQRNELIKMSLCASTSVYIVAIGFPLTALADYKIQVFVFGAALAANCGVGWWAIPRLHVSGAALALGIGNLTAFFIGYLRLRSFGSGYWRGGAEC